MKLLTKEIEASIPALYSQEKNPDPTAVVKFFDPCGRYTFYVTEGERITETPGNDWLFFGWCVSPLGEDCDEFGYARLSELQGVRNRLGLGIERDKFFRPRPLSEIKGGAA